MLILWLFLGTAAVFFAVLAVRAAAAGKRPAPGQPEPPVPRQRQLYYAEGLGRMLRCATVSHKGGHDDAEFAKLRDVVAELFPLVHARAEKMTFGEDCWMYRLPGRDGSRRILLMSHHDVAPVDETEAWAHAPFGGEIAGDAVWGRGGGIPRGRQRALPAARRLGRAPFCRALPRSAAFCAHLPDPPAAGQRAWKGRKPGRGGPEPRRGVLQASVAPLEIRPKAARPMEPWGAPLFYGHVATPAHGLMIFKHRPGGAGRCAAAEAHGAKMQPSHFGRPPGPAPVKRQ